MSLLDIAFLLVLLYVLNFYMQPQHTFLVKYLPEIFIDHPALPIAVFFILFTIKNTFGFLVSRWQYRYVYHVASRISRDNLNNYLDGSYHQYINTDSSVINRKISQQPIEFCHYVLTGMQQVFSQLIIIVITISTILFINPLIFPLLMLILTPPVLLISFIMRRNLDAGRIREKETGEKALQYLQEALSGYVESNVYKKKNFLVNRYHRFQKQLNQYLSDRLIIQALPTRLIEVFTVFGLAALIWINLFVANNKSVPLITIGSLMVAAYKVIPGIVKIINAVAQIKNYAFTTAGLVNNDRFPLNNNDHEKDQIHSVTFQNVFFNYPFKNVLNNFSLTLRSGDIVAIMGMSGKGKTTFVNLLLGFLKPQSGHIFINGRIADVRRRQGYWHKIAYIKQQPFFLNASILENITLEDNHYDHAKVKRITSITGIDKMVENLPDGLKTVITENGKNFSGGQRQRIIFARALYKDFDLLILDEPFNELDERSEAEMLHRLKQMSSEGKIILLITHNTAALPFCNKKILMDEYG